MYMYISVILTKQSALNIWSFGDESVSVWDVVFASVYKTNHLEYIGVK